MITKSKGKVLILSGTFGQGHQQVAKAIEEAANLRLQDCETIVVDFMAWAHPNVYPISHYVYMKSIQKLPQLYGYLYQKTHDRSAFSIGLSSIISTGIGKMLKLLQQVQPTVVVCTFPFAAGLLSKLKEYGLTNVPLITIITDYTTHSYWLHPFTDHYIVGSASVRQELVQLGISRNRVSCKGIPIRLKFGQTVNREEMLEKYGVMEAIPTILIMGGGDGLMGEGLMHMETLDALPFKAQFLILCGHNESLRQRLKEDLKASKHYIKLFGFIEHVEELMTVADLIVTKPGGVTTTEAISMGLPMVLYKSLPGQEQENAKFLTKAGVAIQVQDTTDLMSCLSIILSNEKWMQMMRKNAIKIQKKAAALNAIDIISDFMIRQKPFYDIVPSRIIKWRTSRLVKRTGTFYSHV